MDGSLSRREQPAGRQSGDPQPATSAPPHAASPAITIPTPVASRAALTHNGTAAWRAPLQHSDPADRDSPRPHSQPQSFRSALERVSANLTPILGPHPAWGVPEHLDPPAQMLQSQAPAPEPAVQHPGLQEGTLFSTPSAGLAQPVPCQPIPAAETTARGFSQAPETQVRHQAPSQQSQAALLAPQTLQTPPHSGQNANSRAGNLQAMSHAPQGAQSAPSSLAAVPALGLPASCPEAAPPRQIDAPAQQAWPHMHASCAASQHPRRDLPWDPAGGSQQLPSTRQQSWDQGESSQQPQARRQARLDQPWVAEDPAELQFREAWGIPRGTQGRLSGSDPGSPGGEALMRALGQLRGTRQGCGDCHAT